MGSRIARMAEIQGVRFPASGTSCPMVKMLSLPLASSLNEPDLYARALEPGLFDNEDAAHFSEFHILLIRANE